MVLVLILAAYFIHVGNWFEETLPTVRNLWDRYLQPSRWFKPAP